MLKGKRVLTSTFFGTVLNDAENEQVLIMHAIRRFIVIQNDRDIISVIAGVPESRSGWIIVDDIVAVPWHIAGPTTVCNKLPKSLYARRLSRI